MAHLTFEAVSIKPGDGDAPDIPAMRVTSPHVELVFATGVGPRVLAFAARGGPNVFGLLDATQATADVGGWRVYGGHRLWAAPEHRTRTYAPDNDPIVWRSEGASVTLRGDVDAAGLVKELALTFDANLPKVRIEHRITNRADRVTLAPWALSVMAKGGVAFVPNSAFVPHPEGLLPSRPLVVWPYTWLGDPRLTWGRSLVRLTQSSGIDVPLKLGAFVEQGWAAYATGGALFIKHFPAGPGPHPDMGCNFEMFTDGRMLELESLGPLVTLACGESVAHVEEWSVFAHVQVSDDDGDAARVLASLVAHDASFRQ